MISENDKFEWQFKLNEKFDKAIKEIFESQTDSMAEDEVYKRYEIEELMMGDWNGMAGADEEETEYYKAEVAEIVGVSTSEVIPYLDKLIRERAMEIRRTYDGGKIHVVLNKARKIRLRRIDRAKSNEEASEIVRMAYPLIDECRRYWVEPPQLDANGDIKVKRKYRGKAVKANDPVPTIPREFAELEEDEIPF